MTSNDECFYDANFANFARYDIEKMLDKHGLIDNGYGNFDDIDIVPTKDVMMKMFDKESNAAERRAAQLAHLCEVLKLKNKKLHEEIETLKKEKEDYKCFFHCAQDALKEAKKSNA
jgi:vacuolar-type H+-ATPase catalytic subunit A/Vma1